jgi:hypothetical protein
MVPLTTTIDCFVAVHDGWGICLYCVNEPMDHRSSWPARVGRFACLLRYPSY